MSIWLELRLTGTLLIALAAGAPSIGGKVDHHSPELAKFAVVLEYFSGLVLVAVGTVGAIWSS